MLLFFLSFFFFVYYVFDSALKKKNDRIRTYVPCSFFRPKVFGLSCFNNATCSLEILLLFSVFFSCSLNSEISIEIFIYSLCNLCKKTVAISHVIPTREIKYTKLKLNAERSEESIEIRKRAAYLSIRVNSVTKC